MNQTRQVLSNIWNRFQASLFPWLQEELGELTGKQQQLIEVLEIAQIETHLPYVGRVPGRPPEDRCAIARAFVAKAVYNLPTTEMLLDQLKSDITLRRICGWEKKQDIPSRATFSRAFAEFAESQLAERIHAAIIDTHLGNQLIGHICRDSTAIAAREKPEKKAVKAEATPPKKRGRPKKGEERIKEPTRLEKQSAGMSLSEMKDDLPTAYDAPQIKQHSESLGHVPLIDENPRGKERKAEVEAELKRKRKAGYKTSEAIRYNERGTVERVNGRLKDDFGARMVRVKGHAKVMAHLMFGVIALTVDQLMKFVE